MASEKFCFVCGFDLSTDLDINSNEVKRYAMCLCCDFHYGIEDFDEGAYIKAREKWINNGVCFDSELMPSGREWSLDIVENQLKNLRKVNTKGEYFRQFSEYNSNWHSNYDENLLSIQWHRFREHTSP